MSFLGLPDKNEEKSFFDFSVQHKYHNPLKQAIVTFTGMIMSIIYEILWYQPDICWLVQAMYILLSSHLTFIGSPPMVAMLCKNVAIFVTPFLFLEQINFFFVINTHFIHLNQ